MPSLSTSRGPRALPAFVALADVRREIGVGSVIAILRWSDAGEFPRTTKLGGKHYVPRRAYERWLEKHLGSDDPPPRNE